MRSVNHGLRDLVCFWDDIERQQFIGVSPEDGTKLNIKMHFPG